MVVLNFNVFIFVAGSVLGLLLLASGNDNWFVSYRKEKKSNSLDSFKIST